MPGLLHLCTYQLHSKKDQSPCACLGFPTQGFCCITHICSQGALEHANLLGVNAMYVQHQLFYGLARCSIRQRIQFRELRPTMPFLFVLKPSPLVLK